MGYKQIRTGQLIAPFGPGSIYTDRQGMPQVIAGLDYWFMKVDRNTGHMVHCSNPDEFRRSEPRLSALLGVNTFCLPPDYRRVGWGQSAPPNDSLKIPAQRFPRWYRHTRTGEMKRFGLELGRTPKADSGRWQPVRFIAVCAAGHLADFPWKAWIDCQCQGDEGLRLTDRGGSELTSVRIECTTCPEGSTGRKGRHIAGTTTWNRDSPSSFARKGILCPREKPWLGEGAVDIACAESLVGALINQTNIYFPRTISAISLPALRVHDDGKARLIDILARDPSNGLAQTLWAMSERQRAALICKPTLDQHGLPFNEAQVIEALEHIFESKGAAIAGVAPRDPEPELLEFRRAEFNVLREEVQDDADQPELIVVATDVAPLLTDWIGRVTLVERLKETRVFYGFDRLQPRPALEAMPQRALQQLFRSAPDDPLRQWLPAIEVFGEGIYVELKEERLAEWMRTQHGWLQRRLDDGFLLRLGGIGQIPAPTLIGLDWAARYLLVHSLAHILINQLVFECGYSTASLRERLYVSADAQAPMASLLIYTAAGDTEGTLGGLVRLGHAERLEGVIRRALDRASWCSADPVCSEHMGGQGSRYVNLAACQACMLLPETSCETVNQGLDRALIVGTPAERDRGFMSELVTAPSLE